MNIWQKISYLGVKEDISQQEKKSILFVNRIGIIVSMFVLTSIVLNLVLGTYFFIPFLSGSLIVLILNFYFNSKGLFLISKISLMVTILSLLSFMSMKGAAGSAIEFYFLSFLPLPMIIFRQRWLSYFFQTLCVLCLINQHFAVTPLTNIKPSDQIVFDVFFVVNSFYSGLLIVLSIIFFKNINQNAEQQLINKNKIIEDKNAELEAANKGLDTFTYSVSHDLQAPLRAINGLSKIVETDYADKLDDEGKNMLALMQRNATKMKKLIDDLLTFSRADKKEMMVIPLDMNRAVEEVLEEIRPVIIQNNAKIKVNVLLPIHGDYVLIKQVLTNLIGNAIKYSAKATQPTIEIGSYQGGNEVIYFIKDNGIGFDMKYVHKLFNVFQRLHNPQDFEGTGVGLAIVQTIIKKHGGRVWAESTLNQGATFYFALPTE